VFVREWMTAPAVVAPASMAAPQALGFMEEHKIRRLPVVEDRLLVGLVTQGDLMKALGPYPSMWRRLKLKVSDVMKVDPVSVSPEDTLEAVARLMMDRKIGGIPVVEDRVPVGMITESDVFRALCEILGFGDKSARVAFTAPADGDVLAEVRDRLKDRQMRTLMAHLDENRKLWEVVLRLRGPVLAATGGR
jgi:acetoin utilization protein AcuB